MFSDWISFGGTRLQRHDRVDCYRYRTSHKAFDADGAPNAYHPDDTGLDANANAGYGQHPKDWWPDVLARDPLKPHKPYIQSSGEFAGFYVAKTALHDKSKAETDPAAYVDSRFMPYIVFPGQFSSLHGTGRLGDIGIAHNLSNGMQSPFIVADIGPSEDPLGEMSIALGKALGGHAINPRNGAGAPQGEIVYVIFRYSSDADSDRRWPLDAEHIAAKAAELLASIGGIEAVIAPFADA